MPAHPAEYRSRPVPAVRSAQGKRPFPGGSGCVAGSRIVTAYLVIGLTIETISTSCTPSCRIPSGLPSASNMRSGRFTWPETKQARRGIEPRARHAGDGVGAAGTGGDHRDAEIVGGLAVVLRRRWRWLAHASCRSASICGAAAERFVQMHRAAAGHQEHVFDALIRDELHHVVGELWHGFSGFKACAPTSARLRLQGSRPPVRGPLRCPRPSDAMNDALSRAPPDAHRREPRPRPAISMASRSFTSSPMKQISA